MRINNHLPATAAAAGEREKEIVELSLRGETSANPLCRDSTLECFPGSVLGLIPMLIGFETLFEAHLDANWVAVAVVHGCASRLVAC